MCLTRNLNICVPRVNISITPVGTVISGCHCVRCSCRSDTLCRIQFVWNQWVSSPWLLSFPNKYYVLNTWCGYSCWLTSWYLVAFTKCTWPAWPWSGVELFVLTVHRVHCFGSGPDRSGRRVLQGLVAAPRIIRLGENWSPWGRAGALVTWGISMSSVLFCELFLIKLWAFALLAVFAWEHFGTLLQESHSFHSLVDIGVQLLLLFPRGKHWETLLQEAVFL